MAKQSGVIKFTGKLGDLVGYRRKKDHILRRRPEKVHQTLATRQAAHRFGLISQHGKLIRQAILPLLDVKYDGALVNRINKTMILAASRPDEAYHQPQLQPDLLRCQLQALQGFRFNPQTELGTLLPKPAIYTPEGMLQLPAQVLRMPQKATHAEIHAVAVRINFADRRITGTDQAGAVISLDTPFNGLQLPLSVPGKGVLFVILQLRACNSPKGIVEPFNDCRYMAANIITVVPSPTPIEGNIEKECRTKQLSKTQLTHGQLRHRQPQHRRLTSNQLRHSPAAPKTCSTQHVGAPYGATQETASWRSPQLE